MWGIDKSGGEGGIRTPGRGFGPYNGLANSPFHSLVFGTKDLCSGELPYFGAKHPCLEPVVQLLCNSLDGTAQQYILPRIPIVNIVLDPSLPLAA
jgi:hypothetical protein